MQSIHENRSLQHEIDSDDSNLAHLRLTLTVFAAEKLSDVCNLATALLADAEAFLHYGLQDTAL